MFVAFTRTIPSLQKTHFLEGNGVEGALEVLSAEESMPDSRDHLSGAEGLRKPHPFACLQSGAPCDDDRWKLLRGSGFVISAY